jgi:endonuclease YncB( thermonuclease family)
MLRWCALFLLLVLPAVAQTLEDGTGVSHGFAVVDGDTVRFGRTRLHLFGIDAPKSGQACDNGTWHPAALAKKALVDFIAGRPVACRQVDQKSDPSLVQCFAGTDDLQALMVSAGWAWASMDSGDQYADAERRAAARGRGVHAHRCRKPGEVQAQRP